MKALTLALPLLVPLAARWCARVEARVLRLGEPLSEEGLADARTVGVKEPGRVRVLHVKSIPDWAGPFARVASRITNLLTPQTAGLSLRHGILVREDCGADRFLIAHECVHTAQYERMGGMRAFLWEYLRECFDPGYPLGALEQEAIRVSAALQAAGRADS